MVKPYYLDNVALSKSHDNDATRHFAMTNVAAKHIEMKITQPIFGILVALTEKQTYQNDMKST